VADRPITALGDARAKLGEIRRIALAEWHQTATGPTLEPTYVAGLARAAEDVLRVLEAPPGFAAVPRLDWPTPAAERAPPGGAPARRPLQALTIHQPYAWAIAGGWKPVENREWPPPAGLISQHVAIHAGRQYDAAAARDIVTNRELLGIPASVGVPDGRSISVGAIVAVAKLAGVVRVERDEASEEPRLKVLEVRGDIPLQEAGRIAASPWACGPFLWVLRDVTAIEPLPCRGFQKLWSVPDPELATVRVRWMAAREALRALSTPATNTKEDDRHE
jgi:hypothetical protein